MRRSALLLAAPVLAAGLLAGCDLPAGSPRALGPDQVPNNTAEEAPTISVPAVINGSLDPNDQRDFFRLERPTVTSSVRVVCTGDVEVGQGLVGTAEQSAQDIVVCDGQPHFVGLVRTETTADPVIAVLPAGDLTALEPYFLAVSYVPAQP